MTHFNLIVDRQNHLYFALNLERRNIAFSSITTLDRTPHIFSIHPGSPLERPKVQLCSLKSFAPFHSFTLFCSSIFMIIDAFHSNLLNGRSVECSTFRNEALSPGKEVFEIKDLEIWCPTLENSIISGGFTYYEDLGYLGTVGSPAGFSVGSKKWGSSIQ